MIVGNSYCGAIYYYTRTTCSGAGVRAVVLGIRVVGEAGNLRSRRVSCQACAIATTQFISTLNTRVAVLVLKSDVSEVNTSVDHTKDNVLTSVLLCQS